MDEKYTGYYLFSNDKKSFGGVRAYVNEEQSRVLLSIYDQYKYEESDLETASEFLFSMEEIKSLQMQLNRFVENCQNLSQKEKTQIRIAGNTIAPCLAVIRQKGYHVESYVHKDSDGEYSYTWNAEKENCRFSATCPVELLGLINMWEVRGSNWKASDSEYDEYRTMTNEAPVYDDDGNLIEDE
jgi:hypothetical protein